MSTSGSEYLAESLAAYGVSHVFMVPTVAVTALARMADIGIVGITAHSEKAAAYMADGYGRASGRPGICMAQTIGSANLASGLREPRMMGAPVIAITGGREPMTKHRYLYQEIVDFPIYDPLTKWNAEVDDVRRVPDMLRQAFRVATTGAPGPVHLELRGLGADVLDDKFELDEDSARRAEERFARAPAFRPVADDADVCAALALLRDAQRPVILAGGGARTSGAQDELLELATTLKVPVVTSLSGKGLVAETHPLAAGCVGASSRASANQTVADADLVCAIGTHLGSQVTDRWRLPAPGTTVIQVDIDPAELGRNYPNAVSLSGDAKATLRRMVDLAKPAEPRDDWLALVERYVREFRTEQAALLRSDAAPIRPERLCSELTDALPDDAVLTIDTGHSGIWVASMVDLKPTQTFLRAGGSLGWAFPAALGAKCALRDRPVVCFAGDGGLYYHLGELETAARHEINVTLVVNNNNSLSQDMKVFEQAFGGPGHPLGEPMWAFREVNLSAVGEELGCLALRVERAEDIGDALRTAMDADRPAIVDVATDVMALPDPPRGGVDFYATPET